MSPEQIVINVKDLILVGLLHKRVIKWLHKVMKVFRVGLVQSHELVIRYLVIDQVHTELLVNILGLVKV